MRPRHAAQLRAARLTALLTAPTAAPTPTPQVTAKPDRIIRYEADLTKPAPAIRDRLRRALKLKRRVRPIPMKLTAAWFGGGRDWWPFTRIIITAAALVLGAHFYLGWEIRPREVLALSGQVLGVLSILAMISFVLADLYLLLFLGPLYIVGVLNDWFYLAPRWAVRVAFRRESRFALGLAGLCGEVLLFGGLGLLLRHFASGSGFY